MEITNEVKQRIAGAIASDRENYPSDNRHATALGIAASVYNAIKKGNYEKQVSDANWVGIARRLGVQLRMEMPWTAAKTPTYVFISKQLEACQDSGLSAILCDMPNIGKTFTAKAYVKQHRNAVYVDCSQVKTKLKLIRYIAKEFGVGSYGRYSDVYEDLVAYLRTIDTPLVVLDEAGDLQYEAFLELKALWNATERCCAWYMMGADGLKEKINRAIEGKKVGYTEMLSRYGDTYSKVTPDDAREREKFLKAQGRHEVEKGVQPQRGAEHEDTALRVHGPVVGIHRATGAERGLDSLGRERQRQELFCDAAGQVPLLFRQGDIRQSGGGHWAFLPTVAEASQDGRGKKTPNHPRPRADGTIRGAAETQGQPGRGDNRQLPVQRFELPGV